VKSKIIVGMIRMEKTILIKIVYPIKFPTPIKLKIKIEIQKAIWLY